MRALAARTQFDVPSESMPGLMYVVTIAADGVGPTCTCPDFIHRRRWVDEHCKHIRAVMAYAPGRYADDAPTTYRRLVAVDLTSHRELDEDDLTDALRVTLSGIGVRVEAADTTDTTWAQITVRSVTRLK
jgi:hypothetical protein